MAKVITNSLSTKDIIIYSLLAISLGLGILSVIFHFINGGNVGSKGDKGDKGDTGDTGPGQPNQLNELCIGNTCLNETELQNIKSGTFTELKTQFLNVDRSNVGTAGGQCISLKGSPSEKVPYISYYNADSTTNNGKLQVAENGELLGINKIGTVSLQRINNIINEKNIASVAPLVYDGTLKNYTQCITDERQKIVQYQIGDDAFTNATRGGMCELFYNTPSWKLEGDTSDDRKDIYKNPDARAACFSKCDDAYQKATNPPDPDRDKQALKVQIANVVSVGCKSACEIIPKI